MRKNNRKNASILSTKKKKISCNIMYILGLGILGISLNSYFALNLISLTSINIIADKENDQFYLSPSVNRRKFVSYTSSQWEKLWLENIETWEKQKCICEKLLDQKEELEHFIKESCVEHIPGSDYCLQNDPVAPFWINIKTLEMSTELPPEVEQKRLTKPKSHPYYPLLKTLPEDQNGAPLVFSKFIFLDQVTGKTFVEYIEPLVSHLRHPLALCQNGEFLLPSRSYVIPPPPPFPQLSTKNYYFDAGASVWNSGGGGPSLSFFTKVWLDQSKIDFYRIQAWDGGKENTVEKFYNSIPLEYSNRTFFAQQYVSQSLATQTDSNPFIPSVIRNTTNKNDYVLFKLDIDTGHVEMGIVNHLLSDDNDDIEFIDEFVFEHHVAGNYLLLPYWKRTAFRGVSLLDSYKLFLDFRKKGVRSHSWV